MNRDERNAILEKKFEEILLLLTPKDVREHHKLRIGAYGDGGYVMLDPGQDGIAYSFGISNYSPWDKAMAERGYKIYQYDGTISQTPFLHPLIFFHPYNIGGGTELCPGTKNISQIIQENNHEQETDIILQIDIEGAEWNFFEHITTQEILKFDQIIAEFHWILDIDRIDYYISVLKKICETHQVIHLHYNNYGGGILFKNFIAGQVLEVSFVKKEKYIFNECTNTFPTQYDSPNCPQTSDIIIGNFSLIQNNSFENFVSDKNQLFYFNIITSIKDIYKNQLNHIEQLHNQSQAIDIINKELEAAKQTIIQLSQVNMRLRHPFRRLWGHITGKKYPYKNTCL